MDRYLEFTRSPLGRRLVSALGLPAPPRLRRALGPASEQPLQDRVVLIGGAATARFGAVVLPALRTAGAELRLAQSQPGLAALRQVAQRHNLSARDEPAPGEAAATGCYLFDASGIARAEDLRGLYDFFHARLAHMPPNARCVLVSEAPSTVADWAAAAVQAALRGFVRSLARELGRSGGTANLVEVSGSGQEGLAGPLRFLLGDHAAFVTGQVIGVGPPPPGSEPVMRFSPPLADRVAVVTGAARGIGAAIARTFAREGAQVIGIDRPQDEAALGTLLADIGGHGLALDIAAADAGERIASEVGRRFGGLDIVVHNAGITRDKMLKNMPDSFWTQVLDINLGAILRITARLLDAPDLLRRGGRFVCVSSIGGLAGNAGQTNYAASKAGVVGMVEAAAAPMAARGLAINAVAPGFIETVMTAAMPALPREVGRRLSSLGQAGLPQDVAEAVLFLASPAAVGVNGRTLRVCGQNWVGA